eukprot:scaffold2830_cov131-Cylindrotheca_fusiformis.AAC.90
MSSTSCSEDGYLAEGMVCEGEGSNLASCTGYRESVQQEMSRCDPVYIPVLLICRPNVVSDIRQSFPVT